MDIKKILYVVSTMGLAVMLLLSVALLMGEQVPNWGVLAFGGLFAYMVGKDIDKQKQEISKEDVKRTSAKTDMVMQELKVAIDERFGEKERA